MRDMDVADARSLLAVEEQANVEEFEENEITRRNQQDSPLLRLPTEVRERIWAFAFGCRTIHVEVARDFVYERVTRRRVFDAPRIAFYPCHEYLSEHAMYELSLRGASPDNPGLYAAEELYNRAWKEKGVWQTFGRAGMHDACIAWCQPRPVPEPFGPPPICKQIRTEATRPAWRTTSFAFTDEDSFGWFARLVPEANRRLVTQLTIRDKGFRYADQWRRWHASFTPATLAALPSLQGIHLILNESVWYRSRGLPPSLRPDPSSLDIMHTFPDAHAHIVGLARLLRKRNLRPERTTVFLPQSFLYRPRKVDREEASTFIPGTKNYVPRDDPRARWLCKPWRWHLDAGEMVQIARGVREVLLGGGEAGDEMVEEEWGVRVRMPVFTGDNLAMFGRY